MPHCAAVPQQPAELLLVLGRGDDRDLAQAGQHQHRQRIVDHRLVVERQQLLRQRMGDRIEPGARAAGEDDALARRLASLPAPRSPRRARRASPAARCRRPRRSPRSRAPSSAAAAPGSGRRSTGSACTAGARPAAARRRSRGRTRPSSTAGAPAKWKMPATPSPAPEGARRCARSASAMARAGVGPPRWSSTTRSSSRSAPSRSMVFTKFAAVRREHPGRAQDHVRPARRPRPRPRRRACEAP